ncbi:MurR/RpiR family transcriptional regulator [Mycoplasmopsis gallinacea]|uniref:SIS domain-containing protein n=1 Tax=Mycoplasmopsis gallinacea TaxID=29556 RepID=A0A6H0V6D9_9BACT|nr:MurR/RpiR family transcriptional regulator [Mycoplasmopsis gallinacea]QIW62543.1 SIS domain-containing protein [Mycoplasmopsis gallinacea]
MISNIKESSLIKKLLGYSHRDSNSGHIAKTLLINIHQIDKLNSSEIAELCATTQSSISKFVKKLGFYSFSDFKGEIVKYRNKVQLSKTQGYLKNQELLNKTINFAQLVLKFDFTKIINAIKNAKKIVINASGGALRASDEFTTQLQRAGYNVFLPDSFSNRYTQAIVSDEETLVIFISNSATTMETLIPTLLCKNKGSKIVAITNKIPNDFANELTLSFQKFNSEQKIDPLDFHLYLNIVFTYLLNLL